MWDRRMGASPAIRGTRALVSGLALTVMLGMPAAAAVYSEVRLEGAQGVDAETILSLADIRRGADLSLGDLNDAQQRLQQSGLFETVEIVPQGSTLVIRVSEYPVIDVISFEGNRRLNDERLGEIVQSRSRRVFSPAQAERDAQTIAAAYASEGRYAARVDPRVIRRPGNRVDLVFEIREGALTEIERIGFTGNRAFSDRRLRNVLATKQAGILRTFIRRDVFAPERTQLDEQLLTDFYRSRGYADFRVQAVAPEIARERDAFFVTYNIYEGPRYTFGRVNVVSEVPGISADAYVAQNRVRPGQVYSPQAVENSIQRLEAVALQQGVNFLAIEPRVTRNPRNQTLDLTFALTRGPRVFVERIDIEGNTTTLDEVIRRQFRTVEGDPLNPREIRNSAERIRALGYFADAQVETREGSSPQQVIVDVNVEEQPTGSLGFGASYGASQGVGFNASLTEQNFLGRGQTVALSFSTASGSQGFDFSFIEPSFLSRDLRARLSAWYRTSDYDNARFNTRSVGISTGIEFPVSENGRVELSYRLSKDKLYDVDPVGFDPETGEWIGSSPILVGEQGERVSSALGYSYNYDTRGTGLDPLTAWKLRFSQDFAGLGGDVDAVTTTMLAGVESRAWREEVALRAEFEAGALVMLNDSESRITDRFRGTGRIRGFESNGYGPRDLNAPYEDALGGNYFWAARAEAQFPLGLPEEYGISGGIFADAGSVWGLDNVAGYGRDTNDRDGDGNVTEAIDGSVDDSMNIRASVGVSLFWTTPIGPLRFNLSKAIKKEDYDNTQPFDLSISTRF
ncbi:outer membrane protein assembly factor BamA [Paracoccus sp. (in: a-proteobacteria)]|uniref:outer membrane protein assembly factor BamA n=1 Tax=Paracoccus sp. TaxID=267 RepID=UPI0026DF90D9|nr:outer membrane protein assembly factor BamA [Paracoccus sp. (in: a-proteobacteria)]MDO5369090.1 outer membrane protein assembly factor BamA [Paracoccus sp. (in: a-proteobacteria)]